MVHKETKKGRGSSSTDPKHLKSPGDLESLLWDLYLRGIGGIWLPPFSNSSPKFKEQSSVIEHAAR